ncbi:MAG: SufD family Fe-S cluster assembly protein [Paludibacteraceae bacterium]|nr:SufD family Fe-S cluster assembly protein [Paludibacteraceae bacterium]
METVVLRDIKDKEMELVLEAGTEKHMVLLSPENVTLRIRQLQGSQLTLHALMLSDANTHVNITVAQDEPGCSTHLYGLALTKGTQTVDLETHVLHNTGGGTSTQLFKNVLDDSSHASFYGELKVLPDAQKTEAFQTNRNILLSPKAKMRTRPQLEIYADDVKCSHGATTGQLDSNALFYLQQRGIPLDEARRLLLRAFFEDVILALKHSAIQEEIREQINKRLS